MAIGRRNNADLGTSPSFSSLGAQSRAKVLENITKNCLNFERLQHFERKWRDQIETTNVRCTGCQITNDEMVKLGI